VVDSRVATRLPKVVWHLDNPVADPAAVATYLISKAAAPEVTVLLSGQGADEIFGGYRVHRMHQLGWKLRLLPRPVRASLLPALLRQLQTHKTHLPGISPGLVLGFCRYSEKLLRTADLAPREQYAAARSYLTDPDLANLFSAEARAHVE